MAVVGIDLGTTYSVIGTPQKFAGKYFEQVRGMTIIKDDYNQRINPSVVALDQQGNLLVGRRAKARAGFQPEPIMFVKRFMGQAKKFKLGKQVFRPEQVSAEILRYLKAMAEKQMGEKIEEVVITVPAYFSNLQKQKTKEAGELAGLRVGKILQEPVAAALAYFHDDDRDPLTIMTYDLGGGTFDVAILQKQGGVFEIKSFDGDPNLGGCDFDKKLAFWIIDRLKEQGFQLDIDLKSPAWSKIMIMAETAKIKLSDQDMYDLIEPNTGITDAKGEPVSIDLQISRQTFESLINDYIDQTIYFCRRAVEKIKPSLEYKEIDEIVMVGGSSRIPLVSQKLEALFGKKPKLMEPELSVAIGAAIMAQRLSRQVGPLKLGYLPETTSYSSIQITGTVQPTEQLPDITGSKVILTPGDGSQPLQQSVSEQGGFIFSQVPLAAETTNKFTLRVENASGQEVVTHNFSIRQEAASKPTQTLDGLETNILAKPIFIMTVSGLHLVASERTPLPCECHVPGQTMDQTGEVRIPIYEDNAQIGEILVEQVPTDLPVGTRVEINLNLRDDFYIDGKAHIPSANLNVQTTIRIPPVKEKDITQLQDEYFKIRQKAEEALAQADRSQAFRIAPRLKKALEESQKILYKERDPNLARAQQLLAEVETLIRKLSGWKPDPPPDQLEQIKREIEEDLLPQLMTLKSNIEEGNYQEQLKAIGRMGDKALAEKNDILWADAYHRLEELRNRIVSSIEHEERKHQRQTSGIGKQKEEPPNPQAIKLKLGLDLTQLREKVRRRERLSEFETDFSACEQALKGIKPDEADAMARLLEYYENWHQPLQARVIGSKIGKSTLPGGLIEALEKHDQGKNPGN
ncbi:MAG: Hsp70 family protein [Candidatus Aminicenantes bacterium]|jgi:molecular chaperone DnaK (HSP70)